MFVLTVDQQGSRGSRDRVPDLLSSLNSGFGDALLLAFERTAGDEVQGLMADADRVVDLIVELVRDGHWWIGIGIGSTADPMPESVREGRGEAYVHARAAVDRAKSAPYPVCVKGTDFQVAEYAETSCWLLAGVLIRRTEAGWQAVDMMRRHHHQKAAAQQLAISPQAMSRRLHVAGYAEEQRARELTRFLLSQ